mmetsp:Transcript_51985/g.111234  ORF Transcript_51985/g.111234 Transcript_51985/m.111234 type:complete len:230 (+) Transcript_51985:48-737(+)
MGGGGATPGAAASGWQWPGPVTLVVVAAILLPVSLMQTGDGEGDDMRNVAARLVDDTAPDYSLAELHRFNSSGSGEGPASSLLLAVWGRVFNVTAGSEFYGEGQGYSVFAGHDCTRAFAVTSTKRKWLDRDLDGLSEEKIRHLNDTYWGTYVEKYPIVGRLIDPPYDAAAYDSFAGPYADVKRSGSSTMPEVEPLQARAKPRQSKCPVTRAARAVGSAIADLLPRLLLA